MSWLPSWLRVVSGSRVQAVAGCSEQGCSLCSARAPVASLKSTRSGCPSFSGGSAGLSGRSWQAPERGLLWPWLVGLVAPWRVRPSRTKDQTRDPVLGGRFLSTGPLGKPCPRTFDPVLQMRRPRFRDLGALPELAQPIVVDGVRPASVFPAIHVRVRMAPQRRPDPDPAPHPQGTTCRRRSPWPRAAAWWAPGSAWLSSTPCPQSRASVPPFSSSQWSPSQPRTGPR